MINDEPKSNEQQQQQFLAGVHLDNSGVNRPHSDLFPSDTDEDNEGANDFLNEKEVSPDAFGVEQQED